MSVPKCKECEDMRYSKYDSGITFRWCINEKTCKLGRYIRGNEHKTSPKWCEKRKKVGDTVGKIEIAEKYYFEENRNAHTVENLDLKIAGGEDGAPTLREYLQYGIDGEYLRIDKPFEELTTEELSHAVDFIDYLETK